MDQRCSACAHSYNCIPADGPITAQIYLIGERPGQWEESNAKSNYSRYGDLRCFIGPTGEELNDNYLKLAGLSRHDLRCANTVRCGSDNNRKPTPKEIDACSTYFLKDDLELVQPKVVVLMGATACALVKDREVDLEVEHGIPFWGKLWEWQGFIVPMYHPALGMYKTGMMEIMLTDWEKLGKWLEEPNTIESIPNFKTAEVTDYRLALSRQEVINYFYDHHSNGFFAAIDTESHAGVPWSIQVSTKAGTGLMVRLEDKEAVFRLTKELNDTCDFYLHHAPADLPILDMIHVRYEGKYEDTMMQAYHLGNVPQGLKALGYRLFGVRMQDWNDLVTPYSRDKIIDYLIDAIIKIKGQQTILERYSEKTGKRLKDNIVKLPEEGTLRALLRYTQGNPKYSPWKSLKGEVDGDDGDLGRYEWLSKWLKVEMGPWPDKGIAHVPLEQAVVYGCRDADITLRVAMEMVHLRGRAMEEWGVQEYDYDQ